MIVSGLWIGPKLNLVDRLSIKSFLDHGHEYHLYTYGHVEGVPEGVALRDASAITPLDLDGYQYIEKGVAPFANVFRFTLLRDHGGIWVDTDVICLRPFEIEAEYCFPKTSALLMLYPDRGFGVDNWFIKVPQGSALMRSCLEETSRKRGTRMEWGALGPVVLADMVRKHGLQRWARGYPFYPVNWQRPDLLFEKSLLGDAVWRLFGKRSAMLHLYRHAAEKGGARGELPFDQGSVFARLLERHLPNEPIG